MYVPAWQTVQTAQAGALVPPLHFVYDGSLSRAQASDVYVLHGMQTLFLVALQADATYDPEGQPTEHAVHTLFELEVQAVVWYCVLRHVTHSLHPVEVE